MRSLKRVKAIIFLQTEAAVSVHFNICLVNLLCLAIDPSNPPHWFKQGPYIVSVIKIINVKAMWIIGLRVEITDEVSFGRWDHYLHPCARARQVWLTALRRGTSWVRNPQRKVRWATTALGAQSSHASNVLCLPWDSTMSTMPLAIPTNYSTDTSW